jgi:RNA polymerase-binding transcription factor DksA
MVGADEIVESRSGKIEAMFDLENESVTTIETTLNDVDRVLERLRVGTYRTCQVCATPIDEADLVATPLLAHCPAHPELA